MPGNPLDLTILGLSGQTLLLAMDSASREDELLVFERNETLWSRSASVQVPVETAENLVISRADLEKALYTVENLRKTEFEDGGDEDAQEAPQKSARTNQEISPA